VRLGVLILPERPWSVEQDRWRRAEALGFDHAWTYDHVAWRDLRDEPWFAAVPTLAAAALVTSTMRLGTLVASPNFRHPVPFAREVITLDDLSSGRLTLGIGAGGAGWDATVLGQAPWTPGERADRYAEFVELLDLLLRQPATTFAGRFWSADHAPTVPGCVQVPRVPFALAATGRRGMRLVARFGAAWVTTGDGSAGPPLDAVAGAAAVGRQIERLEAACRDEGRDPSTIDRIVLTGLRLADGLDAPDRFPALVEAYAAVGVTDLVVHWPRPAPPYQGDEAVLARLTR
jgi:alkanesulfonate monooxygenase SsuD/methylene tetrahydromethanopterin reductase-like flavin-dependent oxidoreductase (luciferase family)